MYHVYFDFYYREAKQHGQSRDMSESIVNLDILGAAQCNSNATRCSVTAVLVCILSTDDISVFVCRMGLIFQYPYVWRGYGFK